MTDVRVLVLRAAGINCDEEIMHCWRLAGAKPSLMHVNALANQPSVLDDFQIVTIPGGFSYGDDIAAGVILGQRIQHQLLEPLRQLVNRGGGILGVCNGFQALVKTGLLPGGDAGRGKLTVTFNDSAHFEARWVRLEVCTDRCPFLASASTGAGPESVVIPAKAGIQRSHTKGPGYLELPVEHAEGKVVTADDTIARQLMDAGQVALRYVDAEGRSDTYPANPNGSVLGIAGLCDPTGRVFGLMPHPDRYFDHTQHPLWTRRQASASAPDGLTIFQNAVSYWKR